MKRWLFPIAGLLFLILSYISATKSDQASAGVYLVLGIIFAVANFERKR